jgi:hypothetical protein
MKVLQCFIGMLFLFIQVSCNQDYISNQDVSDNVAKIISTRSYEVITSEDNIEITKPYLFHPNSTRTYIQDYSWRITHYDMYNNVVYEAYLSLDDDGNEEIAQSTIYQYYSPDKNKRSKVIESESGREITIDYIRNSNGELMEVLSTNDSKKVNKTKIMYNNLGQRIREEQYQGSELKAITKYSYPSNSDLFPNYNLSVKINGNSRDEHAYVRRRDGKILQHTQSLYSADKLTLYYSDNRSYHSNGECKEIISETDNGNSLGKQQKKITFNKHGNVIRNLSEEYIYVYNSKGDWTKVKFKGFGSKYVCERDITYY